MQSVSPSPSASSPIAPPCNCNSLVMLNDTFTELNSNEQFSEALQVLNTIATTIDFNHLSGITKVHYLFESYGLVADDCLNRAESPLENIEIALAALGEAKPFQSEAPPYLQSMVSWLEVQVTYYQRNYDTALELLENLKNNSGNDLSEIYPACKSAIEKHIANPALSPLAEEPFAFLRLDEEA